MTTMTPYFGLVLAAILIQSSQGLTTEELVQFQARTHNESNTYLQGVVNVNTESDADYYVITSNGIPDHYTGPFPGKGNPNEIQEQQFIFRIPKSPAKAASTSCLTLGPIAVSRNGVPLFNPNNIDGNNAVEGEHAEVFDSCDGHPDVMGIYHYHQTPSCIYSGSNDEFIGVALDGFPVYGSKDSSGNELTSADLDSCHGHEYQGSYRYRLTKDFPYILGCFIGTKAPQRNSPPEDCLSGADRCAPSSLLITFITFVFINHIYKKLY